MAKRTTQRFIAKRYKTIEANLYHWFKKHGLKQEKGTVIGLISVRVFTDLLGFFPVQ